jgi:acetyl-CoA decarbonylase/synthase complex subunit gamma
MALKALDIYKLLPKKNCKECGVPTCLTFAMKLASGKADLDLCPYLDETARSMLGASTRPPIRKVKVGVGERSFTIGDETVFYRHEKTFYHQPGIVFSITDEMDEASIRAVVERVRDEKLTRVGADLVINGIAVVHTAADPAAYGRAVAVIEELADLPEVLITSDPVALEAALVLCGGFRPLIASATADNYPAFAALAKKYGCPLAIRAPDLAAMKDLVGKVTAAGVENLVLDLAPASPGAFIATSSLVRQQSLARTVPELGYPVLYNTGASSFPDAAIVAGILKYAGVIVTAPLSKAETFAALTLRQNIYTDPQKPIQMNPGLYRIGSPGADAPVLMTVNFSLTFFTLQGYLEGTRMPCFMLVVDTEGQSVLTAIAAGKLNETLVRDSIKKFDVESQVTHRKVIIPGYASPLSGAIEDASGWKVLVGPRDAAEIGEYLEKEWKA